MIQLRRVFLIAVLIALLSASATTAVAQDSDKLSLDDPLVQDAQWYAASMKVDLEEAVRRLKLQEPAGDLDAQLAEKEADSYAGLWIQHTPEFRIIVLFTSDGQAAIRPYIENSPLAGSIEMRSANASLATLKAAQDAVVRYTRSLGVPSDSLINVFENRVDVHVTDPAQLDAALEKADLQLPDHVEVIRVDALLSPAINIYAGLATPNCTVGFSVGHYATGTKGVTTAGHCVNAQSYNGTNLPFQSQYLQGSGDVQWHTAPGFTIKNWAADNTNDSTPYYRVITGTRHRDSQAIGSLVCKYGRTTGYTCGTIVYKDGVPSWVPDATATFIGVDSAPGTIMALGGDSGGPVYSGGIAYGLVSGTNNANHMVYMAINYISWLGLYVLTN